MTGVVFFVCVSIMFNNIFNEVQSKVQYENKITHEATSKLSEVKHLLTTGQSGNDDYLTLVNSFKVCYQKFNDKQLSSVIYKDKISINDSYKFLQLYDKLIIKECFNDQIYKNLDGDSKRMLKFNIEEINISLSYIKNSFSKLQTFGYKKVNYQDLDEVSKELKYIKKYNIDFVDRATGLLEIGKIESGSLTLSEKEYDSSELLEELRKISK